MANEIIRVDGIKWWIFIQKDGTRLPIALCSEHDLRLQAVPPQVYRSGRYVNGYSEDARQLECAEGHKISIPRKFADEKKYVINRIDAKIFKSMKVLNLDDEVVPIAESKVKSDNNKYFVTSRLMQSKRGLQLVIYAGEIGKSHKAQIFIEPEVKRLDFDRKDLHPDEIFAEVKATFVDGTSFTIAKTESKIENMDIKEGAKNGRSKISKN